MYKNFFNIIDDLNNDHAIMLEKLRKHLPQEYDTLVDSADHFSEDKYEIIRKRVLDIGNDAIREISRNVDIFKISV
jgi:hypothetical protein